MVSHSNFYETKLSPQDATDISIDIAGCLTTMYKPALSIALCKEFFGT
ncbi:MAG: hypothetical protein HWQ36_01615 [Nostoc sp. NMS2]|nr:hypothetical protein [Nostoc sp. NMS2]MBN3989270.1 hypothetical protein [Nostoc sp. NMS2]